MNNMNRPLFSRGNLNAKSRGLISLVTVSVLILACAGRTFAATNHVSFGSFFFRPSSITIAEGDTVIWTHTNTDLVNHTVTRAGSDPICGSNLVPVSCSHTFRVAGTFPYLCTVDSHAAQGMVGVVNVVTPALLTNIIQASTLLTPSNWVAVGSLTPTSNTFIFTDTNVSGLRFRFYRVVEP